MQAIRTTSESHLLEGHPEVNVDDLSGAAVQHDVLWVPITDADHVTHHIGCGDTPREGKAAVVPAANGAIQTGSAFKETKIVVSFPVSVQIPNLNGAASSQAKS